jgi:hypothetical protein
MGLAKGTGERAGGQVAECCRVVGEGEPELGGVRGGLGSLGDRGAGGIAAVAVTARRQLCARVHLRVCQAVARELAAARPSCSAASIDASSAFPRLSPDTR